MTRFPNLLTSLHFSSPSLVPNYRLLVRCFLGGTCRARSRVDTSKVITIGARPSACVAIDKGRTRTMDRLEWVGLLVIIVTLALIALFTWRMLP